VGSPAAGAVAVEGRVLGCEDGNSGLPFRTWEWRVGEEVSEGCEKGDGLSG
jgi:hypothetical protein